MTKFVLPLIIARFNADWNGHISTMTMSLILCNVLWCINIQYSIFDTFKIMLAYHRGGRGDLNIITHKILPLLKHQRTPQIANLTYQHQSGAWGRAPRTWYQSRPETLTLRPGSSRVPWCQSLRRCVPASTCPRCLKQVWARPASRCNSSLSPPVGGNSFKSINF